MKAANIRGLKISGPALVQETLSIMMVVIMRNHLDMSSHDKNSVNLQTKVIVIVSVGESHRNRQSGKSQTLNPTPELDRLRLNLDAIRTPCVLSYTPLRTIIKIICSIFSWVLYEQK